MSTKANLPNNPTTTANLTDAYTKMVQLSVLNPRTTTGDLSYTAPISGNVYNTATYSGGLFAGQGEQGLFLVLQDALKDYLVSASDFNAKADGTIVGTLASLTTTDKTSLVNAVNEVRAVAVTYTAADVLTKIKTVDGGASGLDAQYLNGIASSGFATSAQGTLATNAMPKSGGTFTGASVATPQGHETREIRNTIMSVNAPAGYNSGDIWHTYV